MIKIKYHVEGLKKIEAIEKGIDRPEGSRNRQPKAGELKYISGCIHEAARGYEAQVAPAAQPLKTGAYCRQQPGIIDNSYSGTNDIWKFPPMQQEIRL